MGATFDVDLMRRLGGLLATEARAKNALVLLASAACLQRSPLMGRGFEVFTEDPVLSGFIASAYVNDIQGLGRAACIKNSAAHDQPTMSIEDDVRLSARILRELHLLPFQLAQRHARPRSVMTSYNMINGVHPSEDPLLLRDILCEEWGFDGIIMSNWWGMYSTAEAINAELGLKVPMKAVDSAVRNVVEFARKVTAATQPYYGDHSAANTPEYRTLLRNLVADGIVLPKNDDNALPILDKRNKSYVLVGDHFKYLALSGGGCAEGDPYYSVTPYDAIVEASGKDVSYTPGLYIRLFPRRLDQPGTKSHGWFVEIFGRNPDEEPDTPAVYSIATDKDLIDVPESLHPFLPHDYFVRERAIFYHDATARFRFDFAVDGKGNVKIGGNPAIDLCTNQPPKIEDTPCFNQLSMDRFYNVDLRKSSSVDIEGLMADEDVSGGVGTAFTLARRLGGY